MSGYIEIIDGFGINQGDTGWTAQRQFMTKSGGAATIPDMDDVFPAGLVEFTIPAGLVVKGRNVTQVFNTAADLSDADYMYTINYSTKQDGGTTPDPEDEPETLTIGGEVMQLEKNGNASDSYSSGGENTKSTEYIFVPTATYTKTQVYDTLQAAVTSLGSAQGAVLDANAPATTAKDGFWLCMGIDVQQFFNNDGETKFSGTRTYMYKKLKIKAAAGVYGWCGVWNPSSGSFDLAIPAVYSTVGSFPDTMPTIG